MSIIFFFQYFLPSINCKNYWIFYYYFFFFLQLLKFCALLRIEEMRRIYLSQHIFVN